MQLDDQSLLIFKSIIKRKYKTLDFIDEKALSVSEILQKLNKETSRKRPEENQKFIFKRSIKYMKKALKKIAMQKMRKNDLDSFFLEYYFKETSERLNIPLSFFLNPNRSLKSPLENFAVPKTINNQFISSISKSRKFVVDFKKFLADGFNQEYEEIINFKLGFLSKRWQEELDSSSNIPFTIQKICTYIEKNKKCKMPWNFKEIDEAKKGVMEVLESDC